MDRDHFYITLFSNASQKVYPDNKIAAFTTQLAQPIRLDPAEIWEVGLCELAYPEIESELEEEADSNEVYCDRFCEVTAVSEPAASGARSNLGALMYCDLIAPQFIGTTRVRFLRTFNIVRDLEFLGDMLFEKVYYVPVEKKTFHNIRIEILNLFGKHIAFKDSKTPLKVVLHFRRAITC